jgi:uncharacterized membrane protein YfcA
MMPWAAYLGIGALVGFAAGLLGIGGGVVMVPLLVLVFTGQGLPPEHVLHVALGTAMAAMVFTSLASMRAHHAHGAVDWRIARAMSPGILAGSFIAALLAGFIPTRPLALVVATSMLAAPLGARLAHRLPIKQLRTVFALLLYGFALRMLVGVW